ncbi:MAG: MutS-related protein, partial [Acidimicrobiales bacterium]
MGVAQEGTSAPFGLLGPPGQVVATHDHRDHASDLHLDQIVSGITADREEAAAVEELFFHQMRAVEVVRYRHDVFRDLDEPETWAALKRFCESIRAVLSHVSQARAMRVLEQRQGWVLDAADIYIHAVRALANDLSETRLGSRGLLDFRGYLGGHVSSEEFARLEADTVACKVALAGIAYCVNIDGGRVTVTRYAEEPDYSEEIHSVFERFRQGAVRSYLAQYRVWPGMTYVSQQILGLVVRLFPEQFTLLGTFSDRHGSFFDPGVHLFYRELQFYMSYREIADSIRNDGLDFCYPEVDAERKDESAEDTFDLALAMKLHTEEGDVITNDLRLGAGERIFVVSGPNQGGKTTFARTFGQLHHLAAIGVPVPGRSARLYLCDRIFTHFEREE